MLPETELRQLLIDSCHSVTLAENRILTELESADFIAQLVFIAIDALDYQGDAPMQAAYFLSTTNPSLVTPHEAELRSLVETADGYSGSIAVALGRMRSPLAKPLIEKRAREGWGQQYDKALALYQN